MKHRSIAAMLAAFVLASAVPFTAFADEGETGPAEAATEETTEETTEPPIKSEWDYDIGDEIIKDGLKFSVYQLGPTRLEVKSCLTDDREIEVPEVVDNLIVDRIGKYAFKERMELYSVKLPESIRSIGTYAFFKCEHLHEFNFPNCLEKIDALAFSNCYDLWPIRLNRGLEEMEIAVFQACTGAKSLSIPGRMEVFTDHTCQFMSGVYTLRLCTGVKIIEKDAALNNMYQKRVIIPPTVTEIAPYSIGYTYFEGEYDQPLDIDIYGVKGTAAEEYAKNYGFDFVEFDFKYGDMNNDGMVDANDASLVLADYAKSSAGAHNSAYSPSEALKADVNDDFSVDAIDASIILSYYAFTSGGKKYTPEEFFFLR